MSSKKYKAEDLYDFIEVHSEITCTKCNKSDWVNDDNAEDEFFEQGWVATPNHCYCPDCAIKYLKRI